MKKSKILIGSLLTIALCVSLICGATFALFTSESKANIAVTSGKVNVVAEIGDLALYTKDDQGEDVTGRWLSGNATEDEQGNIKLENMAPYDGVSFPITITNNSTVSAKWQLQITSDGDIFESLDFKVAGLEQLTLVDTGSSRISNWMNLAPAESEGEEIATLNVSIEMPERITLQSQSGNISIAVYAVQSNAKTTDPVAKEEVDKNTIYVYNAEDLKAFAADVNNEVDFKGKTIELRNSIDLGGEEWTPIGGKVIAVSEAAVKHPSFNGTFNGNGLSVSNFFIDASDESPIITTKADKQTKNYSCIGFFGMISSPAVVKNLTVSNVDVKGVASVAAMFGVAYTGRVENCHVTGLIKVEGNYEVGGISGGQAYAAINGCSVEGAEGSYIKGIHKEDNFEGDNIGGIVGYAAEGSGDRIIGNSVSGVSIEGTRKVGGIAGSANGTISVSGNTVSNTTVSCNADEGYASSNKGKLFVGGIFGESIAGTNIVKDNTVNNVTVRVIESHTYDGIDAAIVGGTRQALKLTYSGNVNVNSKVLLSNGVIILGTRHYGADSPETLLAFAAAVKANEITMGEGGSQVTLEQLADIDMSGKVWEPLTCAHMIYDGKNHTIKNLNCGYDKDGKSAFIAGFGTTIKDLTLENVTAKGSQASAFLANSQGSGSLVNCTLKGKVNISYYKEANAGETHAAVGAFFAVVHGPEKVSNLVIDENCVVTLDLNGLESTQATFVKELLLGYGANANSITDEQYNAVQKNGVVNIINAPSAD